MVSAYFVNFFTLYSLALEGKILGFSLKKFLRESCFFPHHTYFMFVPLHINLLARGILSRDFDSFTKLNGFSLSLLYVPPPDLTAIVVVLADPNVNPHP